MRLHLIKNEILLLICKWVRSLNDNIIKSCFFLLKLSLKLTNQVGSIFQDSKATSLKQRIHISKLSEKVKWSSKCNQWKNRKRAQRRREEMFTLRSNISNTVVDKVLLLFWRGTKSVIFCEQYYVDNTSREILRE